MYAIYADRVCIYNDTDPSPELKVVNPELTLADNSAGSLTVTLPPTNIGYNIVERMVTDISVRKDGNEIWAGRVLSESKDFWNNRVLYCEGELAFFNDSVQPPEQYTIDTPVRFISALDKIIQNHNDQVESNRQFSHYSVIAPGSVEMEAVGQTFDTNYDTTMTSINAFIEAFGGHFYVYKDENGYRTIDYRHGYLDDNEQYIEFGVNLLDFTRSWDMTDFATVITPLGARVNKSDSTTGLDEYVTMAEATDNPTHAISVENEDTIATYGRIVKVIHFDDVSDPNVLKAKAEKYLSETQFDEMVIEMSALDLHYLNPEIEDVKLLDQIHVISTPHGLGIDKTFPVTELKIPLDSPEKATFKLGGTIKTNLTAVHNSANQKILTKISKIPNSVLTEARRNATAIIDGATSGYITIRRHNEGDDGFDDMNTWSEAIYISESPWSDEVVSGQLVGPGNRYWIWNMGGFAYMDKTGGTDSPYWDSTTNSYVYKLAITMDGSIVADFITAGVMTADRIQAGILQSVSRNTTPIDLLPIHGSTVNATNNGVTYSGKGTYTVTGKASAASSCKIAEIEVGNSTFKSGDIIGIYISNTKQDNSEHIQFVDTVWQRRVNGSIVSTKEGLSASDSYTLTVPSQMSVEDSNPPTHLIVTLKVPSGKYAKGTVTVQIMNISSDSNVIFDLTSGSLTMKHGFIGLGEIMTIYQDDGITPDTHDPRTGHYNFEVDENGNMIAANGTFAGTLVAASGAFAGDITGSNGIFDGDVYAKNIYAGNINHGVDNRDCIWDDDNDQIKEDYLDLPEYTIGVNGATITFYRDGVPQATTDDIDTDLGGAIVLQAANVIIDGTTTFADFFDNDGNNHLTTIKGGKISTSSFTTSQLDATSITGQWISALGITAQSIKGATIIIYDEDGVDIAQFDTTVSSSVVGQNKLVIEAYTAMGLQADEGDIYIEAVDGHITLAAYDTITCGNDFLPIRNDVYNLGAPDSIWNDIFTTNDHVGSSDRRKKTQIEYGLDRYDALFDALQPCSYRFLENSHGRTHTGLISQDVEEALIKSGLSDMDLAAFVKSPVVDTETGIKDYFYGLRYGEFIALCIDQIQKLKAKVIMLEQTK